MSGFPKNNWVRPSCKGGGFQSGLRGHQSENLALMGTIRPLVKAQNEGSSANSQEIPVSIYNVCPEDNEYQHVTYPS